MEAGSAVPRVVVPPGLFFQFGVVFLPGDSVGAIAMEFG
jgi:hypothetical protein